MNKHPLRPISSEDVETYQRDGVVCLRQVFDQDWVELLLKPARRLCIDGEHLGLLPTAPLRHPSRTCPEVRKFTFESPLGEVCGRILQSREIRYFFEEYFAKAPRSTEKTIWHADRGGWPVTGQMVPSLWLALTPITLRNSLECLAGSHKHDVIYWLFSPNAKQMIQPPDRPNHPDGESLRSNPEARYLRWEMQPGDMLVIHPWTLHSATGNPEDYWRFALSTRVFGDDIRWEPRPDCLNVSGVSFDEMIPGEKPAGRAFPLLWSEDGRRDNPEDYPSGFATTWPDSAYASVAHRAQTNSKGFEAMLARSGGPTPLKLPFGPESSAHAKAAKPTPIPMPPESN